MKDQKIIPSLWFDNNAQQAFVNYTTLFPNSKIIRNNSLVVEASLSDVLFLGINGGAMFNPDATISFMYTFEHKDQLQHIWDSFLTNGAIIKMPLDTYPWSDFYGWLEDNNGVNWQLYLGRLSDVNQQIICPTLMFGNEQQGKCAAAIACYQKIFPNFELQGIKYYTDDQLNGLVQHAQFKALGFTMMAMDSDTQQATTFNEGVSFTIYCEDQQEIDYYWNAFTKDGQESKCGWCKDPFGVSWQIVPKNIDQLLQHPNAMPNLLRMNKIIIKDLSK